MAQKTQTLLVEDLSGEPAAQTVEFGLDGRYYEIDLTKEHAQQLRAELKALVRHAHRVPPPKPTQEAARIRAWAQQNGYEVCARGSIPRDVIQAYRQAV